VLEGIKQWPTSFDMFSVPLPTPGMYLDRSPLCLLLQQLLYAAAPAHVMSEVLSYITIFASSSQNSSSSSSRGMPMSFADPWYSLKLWFAPPAVMAAEGVEGMQREDAKSSKLPDLLSAAISMNTGNSKLAIIKAVSSAGSGVVVVVTYRGATWHRGCMAASWLSSRP
jgi:hypothetical protein